MELNDVGAERAVLAGLVQYGGDAFIEVMDIVTESSFGEINNQAIFKCLSSIFSEELSVDIPTVLSAASKLGLSELINTDQELNYIKSLSEFYVSKENIYSFAVQIKKYEFARDIKHISENISSRISNITGNESINDIISMLEDPVNSFITQDTGDKKPKVIGENVLDYIQYLRDNKCDIIGLPTPFPTYDAAIGGGLRRKCVDLVSARSKVGKSVFGIETALHLSKLGVPVLLLDTEMGKEEQLNRILANMSDVPINDIGTGKFTEIDEKDQDVVRAAVELSKLPFHYESVAGESFDTIINIIKRWVLHTVGMDEDGNTKDCLVIYDYLKLMGSSSLSGNIQEYQALGFQITSLHNLCVKLDIPCLAFTQLNRDGLTNESEAAMSGSDRIIWLCTSFTIFKPKSDEEIAEDGARNGNRKLVPVVARHGPGLSPGDYINVMMYGDRSKLKELGTRNQLVSQPVEDNGLVNPEDLNNIDD